MAKEYKLQSGRLLKGISPLKGAVLAGGAINSVFTDRPIADYDFYFRSQEDFERAIEYAYDDSFWCVHASGRSVTFSDNGTIYQYMHFEYFENIERIFDAFDFTVCMGAYDMDAKAFVLHPSFLTDCAERRLRFHAGTRFPLISALRVLKYQERGYKMPREDVLCLAMACAGLNLNSWDALEHQIGGLYGDRMRVIREGDFDLTKAIEAIALRRDEGKQPLEAEGADREPYLGSAESLIAHLRALKGLPPRLTEAA